MSMNPQFWQGKRVLITGHTGFKGSWLTLLLEIFGAKICGYSLSPPTSPNLFEEADISKNIESHIGDIRDYNKFKEVIYNFKPEIIIHMAAQPLVRYSYKNPIDTYSTNVMGTVNLFQAVREVGGVKVVVNITTDKCYQNNEWEWGYRENDRLGGHDPYSNSKACAELVASCFRESFFNDSSYHEHGCAIASVRAGNVIGGGDWAEDRLIPDILKSFQNNKVVEIRNPHSIRPWQHVLEPLSGYITLAEKLFEHGMNYSEPWNFGPSENDAKSVEYIVKKMSQIWGKSDWHISEAEHPHEANYLKLDCSKARMKLNWRPIWRLDTTLNRIVKWHQAWLNKQDMRAYTINEINEYINDAGKKDE